MKIAWIPPFSKMSVIGKFSNNIVNYLKKTVTVDIWTDRIDANSIETNHNVIFIENIFNCVQKLSCYDIVIYNMGNCYTFHSTIYEILQKIPGVIILHDYVMQDFFLEYYQEHNDLDNYVHDLEKYYSNVAKRIVANFLNGVISQQMYLKYPFFEKLLEYSKGIIVHSNFFLKALNAKTTVPTCKINLPIFEYQTPNANYDLSYYKNDLQIDENKILIITVGHVNENKRILEIIKVLQQNPKLAKNILYKIIGPHSNSLYFREIRSFVNENNLDNVEFLGYQEDDVLHKYLKAADISINLRYPAMEGGSASLVEQMYFGKPIIVTNTGCYQDIPDDCVYKINPENEAVELKEALEKLVSDKSLRETLGSNAKKFADENFDPKTYCEKFLKFADEVIGFEPILNLTDTVSKVLKEIEVDKDAQLFDTLSSEISDMFTKKGE